MSTRENKYGKRAFTISEAADYACVGRSTIEGWIAKGLLPYEELPGRGDNKYRFMRIRRKDLDAFLNEHYQECIAQSDKKMQNIPKKLSESDCFLLPRKSC